MNDDYDKTVFDKTPSPNCLTIEEDTPQPEVVAEINKQKRPRGGKAGKRREEIKTLHNLLRLEESREERCKLSKQIRELKREQRKERREKKNANKLKQNDELFRSIENTSIQQN